MSVVARIKNDGKLQVKDELIEYPEELEGARNLFHKGLEELRGVDAYSGYGQRTWSVEDGNYSTSISPSAVGWRISMPKKSTFTLTATIQLSSVDSDPRVFVGVNNHRNSDVVNKQSSVFTRGQGGSGRFSYTGESNADGTDNIISFATLWGDDTELTISNIKIEYGENATPYTPSPEDLGMVYPDAIQHFSTGFRSNGKVMVHEFIEGEEFSFSPDKKMYLNELVEGVDL